MDAEIPVADVAEPVEAESESLADHEAAFSPTTTAVQSAQDDALAGEPASAADAEARDDKGRFTKHRAVSQRAGAEDLDAINALTKELRQKEAELAKKRPDAVAGSPRLLSLKQRIRGLQAELAEFADPEPAKPSARAVPAPVASSVPSATFDQREPVLADFDQAEDPYTAYQRALAKWDRAKERHDEALEVAAARTKSDQAAAEAARVKVYEAYASREREFKASHPEYDTALKAIEGRDTVTPVLTEAIIQSPHGPAAVLYLAQHPDFLDEMVLLTEGKAVNDLTVATAQRRLHQRVQAVTTGSAAASRSQPAPRPPNPVRTGPMQTGDDVPGDESSLADHERAFGRSRRR